MITGLQLENYRGFEHYALDHLSRVNLLVGRNNCGKTALLEGVHFLASGGDPGVLVEIARRRGEVIVGEDSVSSSRPRHLERYIWNSPRGESLPTVSHFFHGHELSLGRGFSIIADNGITVNANVTDSISMDKNQQLELNTQLKRNGYMEDASTISAVEIVCFDREGKRGIALLALNEDGAATVLDSHRFRHQDKRRSGLSDISSIEFISPDSLDPRSQVDMWGTALSAGREDEIVEAMKVLEPTLTSILFQPSGDRNLGRNAGFLVELEHKRKERIPLGSFGDGMRRMLALATAMIQSSGGVLLIDEIDTGLHYTVMADMWRLVIRAAMQSNVQVFATTHSLDCVQGLASAYERDKELGPEISLQRIDPRLEKSVSFGADEIAIAVQQEVEVR